MKSSAFSLIELVVVIGIVAILTAVALPTYQDYQVRAKFSGLIGVVQGLKNQSVNTYNTANSFTNNTTWTPINYYSSTIYYQLFSNSPSSSLFIHILLPDNFYPGQVGNPFFLLSLQANSSGIVSSTCGTDSRSAFQIPVKYLPAGCQNIITVS